MKWTDTQKDKNQVYGIVYGSITQVIYQKPKEENQDSRDTKNERNM